MFIRTPVYRVNGTVVFGLRRDVVPPDVTDRVVEVTQPMEDRTDLLAFEFYGATELEWAIWEMNHIVDPMTEIKHGVQLRVPTRDRLFNILSTATQ
jgi:hypothetical protein